MVRGYLPQPTVVAQDLQDQLAQVGIKVTLDKQESGTFVDNTTNGKVPFFLFGWGADYPDATNFYDYHFNNPGLAQFGTQFADVAACSPRRRGRPTRRRGSALRPGGGPAPAARTR